MALKRGNEIPTIDVALVTIVTANNATELALNTASNIADFVCLINAVAEV